MGMMESDVTAAIALDEFVRPIGDDIVGSRMRHRAYDEQSGYECVNEQFNFHSVFFWSCVLQSVPL